MRARHLTPALAAGLLLAATACGASSGHPSTDTATSRSTPTSDPITYLYEVDHHHYPRAKDATLVHQLTARCTGTPLLVEFAATNTAVDLVDAQHATQDVYPVLAQLVAGLPATGKTKCIARLKTVEKQMKAARG